MIVNGVKNARTYDAVEENDLREFLFNFTRYVNIAAMQVDLSIIILFIFCHYSYPFYLYGYMLEYCVASVIQ